MSRFKGIVSTAAALAALGTGYTLHAHDYEINSLGIVRLARAGITGFKIAAHYKLKLYSSQLDPKSQEYARLLSEVHTEAAHMLLSLCCANKGVYVKVGQHIGALDYLVPREYVKVMKVLHSEAPPSTFEEILKVLKEDLNRDPYDVFSEIDKEPLGAASLAQAHRAVLRKDNKVVAVKVQHPLVLRNSIIDMKTMEFLVNIMSAVFEEFNFQWLVDETKRNLPKELDFRMEAENAEKIQKYLHNFPWLKIPRVHWDFTTRRVLTMDFEEGGQVNNLEYIDENKIRRIDVSERLGEMYAHMIFKHGFVHSDPHPGNILLHQSTKDLSIILLDHGLYAELTEDFRLNYSKFWMSILARDLEGMRIHSEAMGIGQLFPLLVCMVTGRTWESVTAGIDRVHFSETEKETFQREIPQFLSQIGEVLQKVNRQLLLVLKTNDLLRGIEHTLKIEARQTAFITMTRCCLNNLYDDKLRNSNSNLQSFALRLQKTYALWKLNLYSTYLTFIFWTHTLFS